MRQASYVSGVASVPLLGETIGENFRRIAGLAGDRDALVSIHQSQRFSYAELLDLTSLVGRGLLARGISVGDRVAIWAPNRYEWIVVQLAAARVGAILVCINPTFRSAELHHVLVDSGARLLCMSARFKDIDYVATLAEVRADCPDLRDVLVFEQGWDDLVAAGRTVDEGDLADREAMLQFDEPINIQYTSGTTGRPKGATLTHHNVLNNAHQICAAIDYGPTDRVCVPVPMFHCFGMVLGTLGTFSHGATMVLPAESFNPVKTLTAIEQERCTALYGVPTMLQTLVEFHDLKAYDLGTLRTGLCGGAPCPGDLMEKIHSMLNMRGIANVCGMTETSPISTQTRPSDPIDKQVNTVGRPTPYIEIKVVDPTTGAIVPTGASGEQCTRGYSVMAGYWNNPAATAAAVDKDGWMHTGDLALIDDAGYVSVIGRLKDVIIRGGENIYPQEVENLLRRHSAISDAYVVGIPDQKYGERVMAWVRLSGAATVTEADLVSYCGGQLSRSKVPELWKFTDTFPTTASGKVQKFRMREISIEELGAAPFAT